MRSLAIKIVVRLLRKKYKTFIKRLIEWIGDKGSEGEELFDNTVMNNWRYEYSCSRKP